MSEQKTNNSKETKIKISSTMKPTNQPSVQNFNSSNQETSTSSVKLKKSSNLLSALVKRVKRNKKPKQTSEELKNLHVSLQNLSCASTISVDTHHTEEVELSSQNYDKKLEETLETNASNHSINTKKPETANSLLTKLSVSKKHPSQEEIKKDEDQDDLENHKTDGLISSFNNFRRNTLNITIADGLQKVQDIVANLRESENMIIDLLGKYVKEPGFQKEILNLVSKHNKLQWEAERRSSALANDMWLDQIETSRTQEKFLQATLNSLVKQNRELQLENENLLRKHEQMITKIKTCPEHGYKDFEILQINSFIKHNEKLEAKLRASFKKIESLEIELNSLQKQNESMEQQIRISASKIQNLKSSIHRTKTDNDLDQAALHYKLESKEQILKEAVEAGDVVLEDLDALKRQFQTMPFTLNWSKLKIRGSCLTDLIYLCRSCINELSKELLNVTNQLMLKDKDMQILGENNQKLNENLEKLTVELNKHSKESQNNPFALETEALSAEQKCRVLESEVKYYDGKMENLKKEFEIEKKTMQQMVDEYKKYKEQIEEKDKIIETTKHFLLNMTTENCSLKNYIDDLKNILKESGAGDVVNDFHHNLEELQNAKLLNNQVVQENKTLQEKINVLKERNLEDKQNNQVLNKENKKLVDEIKTLKQQHESQHHNITNLQNERIKYLEEKILLKSIIQQLKSELTRSRYLEENLSDVTKEATKLGTVAEYNKQQGEKLKSEIIEKNKLIAELKTSVQKLNEVQIQNAKEKLSLCCELSEAYQLKEKISEVLDKEVQKNQKLDQSKHEVLMTASLHIHKFQEQQNRERTALQIALKNIKTLEEDKINFENTTKTYQNEIHNLKQLISDQNKKSAETNEILDTKNKELEKLRQGLEKSVFVEKLLKEQLKREALKYEAAKSEADKLMLELTKEIKNAGKVCKKLQEEVAKEIDEKTSLQEKLQKIKDVEIVNLHTQIKTLEEFVSEKIRETEALYIKIETLFNEKKVLTQEKDKIVNDFDRLNSFIEKLVNDFENNIKTHDEKEQIFQNEINESKCLIQKLHQEIRDLTNENEKKDRKINEILESQENQEIYKEKFNDLAEETKEIEKELVKVKWENNNLQSKLSDIQAKYNKCLSENQEAANKMVGLEYQIHVLAEEKEKNYNFYKKDIDDLLRINKETELSKNKQITALKRQLYEISQNFKNEKAAYNHLSEIHKDVSEKLMKNVEELINLKDSKQELAKKYQEVCIKNEELLQEYALCAEENKTLKNKLEEKNNEVQSIQDKHLAVLGKFVSLEGQNEISSLTKNQEETFQTIHDMKIKIQEMQQQITLVELEKSELAFKLQETEKLLETEKSLSTVALLNMVRGGERGGSSDTERRTLQAKKSRKMKNDA